MALPMNEDAARWPPIERRSGPRQHLVYRVAKLVGENREILCLMRNISRRGISVRIFSAVDLPGRLALELAGGRAEPIIKVWQRGDICAFRFCRDIAIGEFLNPPVPFPVKRGLRLAVRQAVTVKAGEAVLSAILSDISVQGAQIAVAWGLVQGEEVELTIPGLARRKAVVRWVKPGSAGLNFRSPVGYAQLAEWSALLFAGEG